MKNRTRLLLDCALFVAMLVAFSPEVTGISLHEWLSLAIVVPTLVHLVVNWEWVVRVTRRLFARIRAVSRINLAIDAALFLATVSVMLSGLLVSQTIASTLGIALNADAIWHAMHSASATATIALLMTHLAMHARWVARTAYGLVLAPAKEVRS